MLFSMDRDGSALSDARADAVRAFAALAPVGARQQTSGAECAGKGHVSLLIKDYAGGIGQDEGVAGFGNVFVEPIDLAACNLEQFSMLHATFSQGSSIEDGGCVMTPGVERVVEGATPPRSDDARVYRPGRVRRGSADELQHRCRVRYRRIHHGGVSHPYY
jgi:hypothetical protein